MEDAQLDQVLATVHALLRAEGMDEAADLVSRYPARAEQTGYDNWNGGTAMWDVYIEVPPADYARLGAKRSTLEEQITARLKIVLEEETNNWYSAKVIPSREFKPDWRAEGSALPKQVRLNIVDCLRLENLAWYGQQDDVEFLSRMFDLNVLPSHDPRYETAANDIWQHTINNDDWDREWVFTDDRFRLLEGPADVFLRFICHTVDPVVRKDKAEAVKLVSHYNEQLRPAGWEIHEVELFAGRPRYSYRQLIHHGGRAVSRGRTVADALNAGWMAKEIDRLEHAIDHDPALAIGTAKDLVESCCKTILEKRGVEVGKGDVLGDLTRKITKELRLVPEGIADEARGADNIRLILRNLTQLSSNLAQLRGLYGTGHGRDGKQRGLQPRHARLAVASAVAFIDFISDTYRDREANDSKAD